MRITPLQSPARQAGNPDSKSLLCFRGWEQVHGLFDFLLNEAFRSFGEDADVPLLLSPVPFVHGALNPSRPKASVLGWRARVCGGGGWWGKPGRGDRLPLRHGFLQVWRRSWSAPDPAPPCLPRANTFPFPESPNLSLLQTIARRPCPAWRAGRLAAWESRSACTAWSCGV